MRGHFLESELLHLYRHRLLGIREVLPESESLGHELVKPRNPRKVVSFDPKITNNYQIHTKSLDVLEFPLQNWLWPMRPGDCDLGSHRLGRQRRRLGEDVLEH